MGNFLFKPPCEYWWFLSPKLLKFLKIWRDWMTWMYANKILLGNHKAQNSQISDIPLFVLLTCCVYVNILFPEPFPLLSLSLFPSLSEECGWNKRHFKALWSFHNNLPLTIPWEPFFVGVFSSRDRKGKKINQKTPFFNVIFELLFPSPLPGASLYFALPVLSHLAWISCHLSWPSTSARRLPSNSSRFAFDPRKWGNLCTRTRGLMRFRNIIN